MQFYYDKKCKLFDFFNNNDEWVGACNIKETKELIKLLEQEIKIIEGK